MSFQDKLMALMNFGVTQVLPVAVKNPTEQAKILPYVGLGIGALALLETLFSHTITTSTISTTPTTGA